jgi:DNA polymerase III gamma/tau subunit
MKVKITEVKYMRRYNLGNYEHEEIAISAVLDEGEDHFAAIANLKSDVASAQKGEASEHSAAIAAAGEPASKPVKEKKSPKKKAEEEPSEEAEENDETEQDIEESEEEEAEEEEEKPAAKKSFKKKPQVYSRASEQHKEILSKVLSSVAPDWKKTPESKEKAKGASQKMEGKEFLDESGEVLESFTAEVKKIMTGKKK